MTHVNPGDLVSPPFDQAYFNYLGRNPVGVVISIVDDDDSLLDNDPLSIATVMWAFKDGETTVIRINEHIASSLVMLRGDT